MNINIKDYISEEEIKDIIKDEIKNIFNELSNSDLKYDIQGILEEYIENLFKKGE